MRVVAGTARGRRLVVPEGDHTRPTADRVREAMFNSLFSLGAIDGARVIDVFAGSGALGLEALSRGAAHCIFAENERRAQAALRENLDALDFAERATVVSGDGVRALAEATEIDLVLLDPPYAYEGWDELLAAVHGGVVAIESDREIDLPPGWETFRVRHYGTTVVTLADAGSV